MIDDIAKELHKSEGMYLHLADGDLIDLSKDRVKNLAEEYWNDPSKLPPHIREDDSFKACDICPFRGENVMCSALKPLLPFLEEIDKFYSYDRVLAFYLKKEGLAYVSETSMQNALQYVTNMAIFEYCEDAKKFHLYFQGIEPFMDIREAVSRLFLNIFWLSKGDREKMKEIIDELRQAVTAISRNSVNRLNLMSNSDAFVNAYVKTHVLAEMLDANMAESIIDNYFKRS